MLTLFSVVTSVKDYIEIVHKITETNQIIDLNSYYDFGAILTYLIICFKNFCQDLFSLRWISNIWSLPIIVPNITSSIISEVSILDTYFHNLFTFLENPISYGNDNILFYSLEKFTIGLVNSIFLCFPTSTAHIITLRRFVIQGLEAGYISGLGTIAGNLVWITSIIFGFRFVIIPWLSLDILRYILGFSLLVKYMWDSYNEKRNVTADLSKKKIFLLTFLLAFTEQTSIFPFLTNISMASDATMLESFSTNNLSEFFLIHIAYLLGILVGSVSLLNFTCWFWENPAFKLYLWAVSSLKLSTNTYYTYLNFFFLYATMVCTICSIPYFGLDYTITNPVGLIPEDHILEEKTLLETSFLHSKGSDKNTRQTKRGRRGRNEKWKRRVERYRAFDASLYDQGIYDLFTIEDLNYGFDRFWLRRKMKRSNKGFRLFPGAWMRSFKKQMSKSQLESFNAPRLDFFRLLFEQAYSPSFHERKLNQINNRHQQKIRLDSDELTKFTVNPLIHTSQLGKKITNTNLALYINNSIEQRNKSIDENSTLRKFIRKTTQRINTAKITKNILNRNSTNSSENEDQIYSKRWKMLFSKLSKTEFSTTLPFNKISNDLLVNKKSEKNNYISLINEKSYGNTNEIISSKKSNSILNLFTKINSQENLSKKENQILKYRSFLYLNNEKSQYQPLTLLHPLKFYLQKNKAFKRKLKFYGTKIYRNFKIENNASYFRVMMKRLFYHYKPTLRWEQTITRARSRIIRKKHSRMLRKLNINKNNKAFLGVYNQQNSDNKDSSVSSIDDNSQSYISNMNSYFPISRCEDIDKQLTSVGCKAREEKVVTNLSSKIYSKIQQPSHFYSIISKKATRYRHQMYKDVLQHWYYSPFNRLLLKLDIDSFIRRQPFSHFLTKKEENLLHLRRFLLSEHYDTLRWYTFMEHYESMKNNIGGTKSFANKIYNQQFQGTFKKIRHLFALTPSLNQNDMVNSFENSSKEPNKDFGFKILKFDQILYNEFTKNTGSKNSFIHEELFHTKTLNSFEKDLINQSSEIIKQYMIETTPIREALIKKLLEEKNYSELTQFLLKGGKIRGIESLTNEKSFVKQESSLLQLDNQFEDFKSKNDLLVKNLLKENPNNLWLSLLKQSRNLLYNREALKIYLTKKVSKYKRRKQFKERTLKKRIDRINKWIFSTNFKDRFILPDSAHTSIQLKESLEKNKVINVTSAIRKALKESIIQSNEISTLLKINKNKTRKKEKTNLLLNKKKLYSYLTNKLKSKKLLTIYSLNKFKKYVISINKQINKKIGKTILESPSSGGKLLSNLVYKLSKLTTFTLKPFARTFKKLYKNTKSLIFEEKKNQTLAFWKSKTKFKERKNQERKKLSSIMPKLDLQNMQERKPRINNTIIKLDITKSDLNFYTNLNSMKFNGNNKQNENYLDLINAFDSKISETLSRKKNDLEKDWTDLEIKKQLQSWKRFIKNTPSLIGKYEPIGKINNKKFKILKNIFAQRFITKAKRRTTFVRMIRSPSEIIHKKVQLKRQLTKTLNNKNEIEAKKHSLLAEKFKSIQLRDSFTINPTNIKQRKRSSFWQKNKVIKSKTLSRKMRYSSLGKLKMIVRKYKKLENYNEIRKWWWQNFLPHFKSKMDILIDLERNLNIKNKLTNLTDQEILDRDRKNFENYPERVKGEKALQIGNKDYKPLNLPEAIRIRQKLFEKNHLTLNPSIVNASLISIDNSQQSVHPSPIDSYFRTRGGEYNKKFNSQLNKLDKIYTNILLLPNKNNFLNSNSSKIILGTNPVPFYGGWDESLRKFVVTNRLLAKTKAGYEMNFNNSSLNSYGTFNNLKLNKFNFERAPLKGMNLATILYWKVPFSPYEQDQFFNVGIDGFAPIGWKRFNFKHSTKTINPLVVTTKLIASQKLHNMTKDNKKLLYQIKAKLVPNQEKNSFKKTLTNNLNRKIKRRVMQKIQNYDRSRDTIRFPSGSLTNQILPLHYLNVFYKRYRLPADRYIKRRLRRNQNTVPFSVKNLNTTLTDITLRRRIKPRRRYHRKNTNTQKLDLLPRRYSFRIPELNLSIDEKDNLQSNNILSRPFAKDKTSSLKTGTKILPKVKKRLKSKSKQDSTNLRIRRLRKRVKQQIIRINPRYKPNIGGFIWPGDYFRLEQKKAPKLEIQLDENDNFKNKRKQPKRLLKELLLPLQPKKSLLQKHNLKLLKRRLEKSQNLNKLHQKMNQLESFLQN